jgi:hypothetical protein
VTRRIDLIGSEDLQSTTLLSGDRFGNCLDLDWFMLLSGLRPAIELDARHVP